MLGLRRASVTIAGGALPARRLDYLPARRPDDPGPERLEDMACEDYFAIRETFGRLLALPGGGSCSQA
jgi:hypothetical protein